MQRLAMWLVAVALVSCQAPQPEGEPCEAGDCAKLLVCDEGTCRRCEDSSQCKARGECAISADLCVATEAGCSESQICKKDYRCTLKQGVCARRFEEPLIEAPTRRGPRPGLEGCPCGCDHSEQMLAELEAKPAPASLKAARKSLGVIADREDAGYITDAMVAHRLRLRAFERAKATDASTRAPRSEEATWARGLKRGGFVRQLLGDLAVRSEFLVFGRTLEIVNGKDKELAPCFRIWLELWNGTDRTLSIELPHLEGNATYDVRRWYLEDTDGEPWDGVLGPSELRSVLLIGYVTSPLEPGEVVSTKLMLNGHTLQETTRALGSWDAAP